METAVEKVAVYSSKNVFWQEVGRISVGYNILPKTQADQWLTKNYVRLVEPQEILREFYK
jgi:hypothetical protein